MSSYAKTVNFAVKDGLASGDPAKVIKGTEIDTEFNNIATMSGTKQDSLPLTDSTAIVFNSGDSTKKVRISAASVATGTTRVLTAQDLDGTIAILSQPATFTTLGGTVITASTNVVTPIIDSGSTAALLAKTNNGSTQAQFVDASSTVNFATFGGAATGVSPLIGGRGEAATGVNFFWGTGTAAFRSDDNTVTQFQVLRTASATRNITVTGSNGGNPTISTTAGSLAITPSVVIAGASLQVGTTPATNGAINIPYANSLTSHEASAGSDIGLISAVTVNARTDIVKIGQNAAGFIATASKFSAAPTTSDILDQQWTVWRDTSGGTTKLYYNNGGVIQSVALA